MQTGNATDSDITVSLQLPDIGGPSLDNNSDEFEEFFDDSPYEHLDLIGTLDAFTYATLDNVDQPVYSFSSMVLIPDYNNTDVPVTFGIRTEVELADEVFSSGKLQEIITWYKITKLDDMFMPSEEPIGLTCHISYEGQDPMVLTWNPDEVFDASGAFNEQAQPLSQSPDDPASWKTLRLDESFDEYGTFPSGYDGYTIQGCQAARGVPAADLADLSGSWVLEAGVMIKYDNQLNVLESREEIFHIDEVETKKVETTFQKLETVNR